MLYLLSDNITVTIQRRMRWVGHVARIIIIIIIIKLQLGWHPVAIKQYTFTHKQYTEYRERNIHNNKKKEKIGKCGPCPVFVSYTLTFALQLREKHG
jgi:hypothetical protein